MIEHPRHRYGILVPVGWSARWIGPGFVVHVLITVIAGPWIVPKAVVGFWP
jgi:hypothetical protein